MTAPTDEITGPIDRSLHEILVVDDNPVSRYATVRLLRSVGFRTREAATGFEALDKADESISAMVLDVHLPDIDGFEVCRILRTRSPMSRLPVLHLSAAYVSDEDKVRGLDSGADAYLTHPVEPAVLVATVQALVRTRIAEAGMRRSEARFRALYAQAPSGICMLDAEGRFADANPALLDLLRRDQDAVVGQRMADFVPPEWVERVQAQTRSAAPAAWRAVFPMQDGAGGSVHVEWRVSAPIEPGISIAVATDVSERVSLEKARHDLLEREQAARGEAERVSRLKDDLIAVLSHELRTPLNAILSWTHVLQKRGGTPELLSGLRVIERNGWTQARLISDILDVSSINMGKLHLRLERVDPADLLATSLETLRPTLDEKGNTLALNVRGSYPELMADPARFQQIVWNLVSNAVKFSPPGSQVRVSLLEGELGNGEPSLRLAVGDDGQGIAPEFLPYLFDRFSQSDAISNRSNRGLGLGLSIVKHLVQLHGGTITASSAGAGRGSEFLVELPAIDDANPATSPTALATAQFEAEGNPNAAAADDSLDGLKVLAVDDDPEASAMLGIILGDRGAVVQLASSFDEAISKLEHFAPDILISDVGMPGRDGYELLRTIRESPSAFSQVPAIALTSFTRDQDVEQAMAVGFDAHFGKPVKPLELIRLIARLVAQRASRRQDPAGQPSSA